MYEYAILSWKIVQMPYENIMYTNFMHICSNLPSGNFRLTKCINDQICGALEAVAKTSVFYLIIGRCA